MHKEVISGRQLILFVFTIIFSTATLFLPSIVTENAGRDGWISIFFASLIGFLTILVVTNLGFKYPNSTPIEYSEKILGKWFGKMVSLIFCLFYVHMTAVIVGQITHIINFNLMMDTSIEVITLVIFFITAYGVKKGLEVLTRANIMILIVILIAMALSFILLLKDLQPSLLTPILANGMKPVLKGAITPAGWFSKVGIIAFLIPFINKKSEARSSSMWGVMTVALLLSFWIAISIAMFGDELVSNMNFPLLKVVRLINVFDYIQNIEEIMLIPWILMNLITICFFYYVTVLMITRFLKIQEVKTLVIPVGLLIFSLSLVLFHNNVEVVEFLRSVWGLYSMSISLGIPLILLVTDQIREGMR